MPDATSGAVRERLSEMTWTEIGGGVSFAPLHRTGKAEGTAFLRFEAGGYSGRHEHPGGEELFVIRGRLKVGELELQEGDYLYTPPGESHDVSALSDAVALLSVPGGLHFLDH